MVGIRDDLAGAPQRHRVEAGDRWPVGLADEATIGVQQVHKDLIVRANRLSRTPEQRDRCAIVLRAHTLAKQLDARAKGGPRSRGDIPGRQRVGWADVDKVRQGDRSQARAAGYVQPDVKVGRDRRRIRRKPQVVVIHDIAGRWPGAGRHVTRMLVIRGGEAPSARPTYQVHIR